MWNHPIVQREFLGTLRRRRASAAIIATAVAFSALVLLGWPSDAQVDLSGEPAQKVFRLFGYGLLAALLLLAPAFPATSIVREKRQGTLVLLLNSPLRPWSIYAGKLAGSLGFVLLLLLTSVPAAAACHAMGGVSLSGELLPLYAILVLVAVEYTAWALLVSTYVYSIDAALRYAYGGVLLLAIVSLGPHYFLQGIGGWKAEFAEQLRCLSPIPAVMQLLGHSGVGAKGLITAGNLTVRCAAYGLAATGLFAGLTLLRLNHRLFDRARSQGLITDERQWLVRTLRRMVFVVDPQRRKLTIAPLVNPVMVKEFRCRRFGRMHWMLRLAAASMMASLGLTYVASLGSMDWGPETIGGLMVLLQGALIVLLTPALAAGLISSEVESGGWQLLQMTPLSARKILVGKLASVVWPILLILISTLPGYLVMVYIEPAMWLQIRQVLICLTFTAVFSLTLSVAFSSLLSRTATATAASYGALAVFCGGTMLVWLLRDSPFGHGTVVWSLTMNPIAAGLAVIGTPGFAEYPLIPNSWWFATFASALFMALVFLRTHQLTRPQ
jgi:ABC-type transport system involved in multi-copper enzyme maturation permease subunit